MDQTRRSQIGDLHDQQRQRAAAYKPAIPEIPTAHGCAGNCSQPPPPPPVSNAPKTEAFRNTSSEKEQMWWMVLGGAAVVYALLCLPARR
jgi:hypothetical protein